MPSTITHAYFALDLYDKLDDKMKNRLKNNLEHLKTFAQGPDFFYFYNILCLGSGKNIRNFGLYVHQNKTKAFFVNLIAYIKNNRLEEQSDVMSFLYGFIAHYVLDSTTHPFIIYKTGIFDFKDKGTYKYFGLHNDMEGFIDAYFIHIKEHIKPNRFKSHKFCFNVKNFSEELSETIDSTFEQTFGRKKYSSIYLHGIKHGRLFYKLFRHDLFGIKKQIYKIFDFLFPHTDVKREGVSYHINPKTKKHYLNLEKKDWCYPTCKNEIYNYSFIELYIIALYKAAKIIGEVNKVLYENRSIKYLDSLFLNLSYTTNKDCNLKLKSKYFEF